MKKTLITALATILILTNFTACDVLTDPPPAESPSISSTPESPNTSDTPESSAPESDVSNVPEPQKPDGEPTFLTLLDGTPIYTSQICEVYKGAEVWGDKEAITLEQAEQFARERSDFSVKCDGFAYGYISERSLNYVDDPEMFKQREKDSEYFDYLGGEFDVNEFEGEYSTDYIGIEVGDKFGPLTVKNAYTLFTRRTWYEGEDFSDVPGVYLSGCGVEFDGEIEMTGYVIITPVNTLYGEGGDMKFIPDGDSSVILPEFGFFLNKKARCVCHISNASARGYCGTSYDIGNMYKVDCDTSGLQPGDSFVKVKVVLDDVKHTPGHLGGWSVNLKSIEVL